MQPLILDLIVFTLLVAVELLYFKVANHYNIIDKPNERSSHSRITLRGGGVIFYFGALAFFITYGGAYPWFILGLTLITLISFADDVRSISQTLRLLFHFSAMALMFFELGLFGMPLWVMVLALILSTGIINAYNFMDGINGITGGYSLVVLAALGYINCCEVGFTDPALIRMLIAAVLVFNIFNFRKKAKCFAGDVGSVGIAFSVLFLIGQLMVASGDLSYIILLVVYGVDSVLTVIHRVLLRENIGLPHRKHLYQIMANELKIPHVLVSLAYMVAQALVMVGFFMIQPEFHYYYLAASIVLLSYLYIKFMRRYFHLHVY